MGYGSCPVGISTCSSSHIHWPEVVKLKKCPSMAKLFTNDTRRPVGWPASLQLPVSSKMVFSSPTSTTSPATPLIFIQSPTPAPLGRATPGHAINLAPVSHADAVAPHQHEPPEEGDDEVLHGDRQSRTRQAQNRSGLRRHTENNEEDRDCPHRLRREFHHRAQSVDPFVLGSHAREQLVDHTIRRVHNYQHKQNPQQRLDDMVQRLPFASLHQRDPVGVCFG